MNRIFILCVVLCQVILASAQQERSKYTINDNWRFLDGGIAFGQNRSFVDDTSWQQVNLPHTWNAEDPFDDEKSYKRGIGWYRKRLNLSKENLEGKRAYLYFEGANQVTDVYVNGINLGRHKGGYTAFSFDMTDALNEGDDQLVAVSVNNAHDPFIPPLSVGFALYGGIYRDVWVVITDEVHFELSEYGDFGLKVSTPEVSAENAKIKVNNTVVNEGVTMKNIEISTEIHDENGKIVLQEDSTLSLKGGDSDQVTQELELENPNLWSPDDPYLYTVNSVVTIDGKAVDKVVNPLGLRWFSFDSEKGFFLNGNYLKLQGTNRHQDFKGKGSALSNEDHRRDMELIKNMGANFIRIAHYPQDPEILRAADELGLLAWEEVPLVNYMNTKPEFLENSQRMIKEMIRQHYNHPSVIMWGSMNEIFLWGPNEDRAKTQKDSVYANKVRDYAVKLDSVIRREDSTRYTTMAMHMSSDYEKYGLEGIADITGLNVYSGWYGGKFADFGGSFDRHHKEKPEQILMVSEYGAGSDQRLNSSNPKRFDFTGQYQIDYNESYLRQIKARDYIAGTAIWNQFDFSQPHTGGSMPHLNQKGMATWDRKPKDVYYLYKANWNREPMVYIAEKDWPVRAVTEAKPKYDISVYSNAKSVTLYTNGKKIGESKTNDINKAVFTATLKSGKNTLRAVAKINGKTVEDTTTITVKQLSTQTSEGLRINVGSNAQYLDDRSNPWIEDTSYNEVYGHKNGNMRLANRKNIFRGSKHDPLYYSYLEELTDYTVKVPDGHYEVTLYFMENEKVKPGEHVFGISVNGETLIQKLDVMKEAGFARGLTKTFLVEATDGKLHFSFEAKKGKTVLNGLEVIKKN